MHFNQYKSVEKLNLNLKHQYQRAEISANTTAVTVANSETRVKMKELCNRSLCLLDKLGNDT